MSRANAEYRKHQRRVNVLARFKTKHSGDDYMQRKEQERAALVGRINKFNARTW
jgi:hypothetical protein